MTIDRIELRMEQKLQDMWIGIFWKGWERGYREDGMPRMYQDTGNPYDVLHVWICLVPCFPLHITLHRRILCE